ncbi:hypothetical protein [Sphingomonas bacterium]|nr:hypothetical protein [Sphingomonas bacterium]
MSIVFAVSLALAVILSLAVDAWAYSNRIAVPDVRFAPVAGSTRLESLLS